MNPTSTASPNTMISVFRPTMRPVLSSTVVSIAPAATTPRTRTMRNATIPTIARVQVPVITSPPFPAATAITDAGGSPSGGSVLRRARRRQTADPLHEPAQELVRIGLTGDVDV